MFFSTSLKTFSLATGAVTLSLLNASPTLAQALTLGNGGFELGNFDGWETLGIASIEDSNFNSGPPEGNFQALLQTDGSVEPLDFELNEFLGLPDDTLFDLNAVGGTAIKTEVTANAGDILSFQWNFLTDEVQQTPFQNDFVFFTIDDVLFQLTDVTTSIPDFIPSNTVFAAETGFQTESFTFPTTGTFVVGFGVVDRDDFTVKSGLLVDKVEVIPEPLTILGVATATGFGAFFKRQLSKKQRQESEKA